MALGSPDVGPNICLPPAGTAISPVCRYSQIDWPLVALSLWSGAALYEDLKSKVPASLRHGSRSSASGGQTP